MKELAASVIDDLKSSPGLLVVAVMNVIIIGALFYSVASVNARRDAHLTQLIERCISKGDSP